METLQEKLAKEEQKLEDAKSEIKDFQSEKDKIATRLMQARFDYESDATISSDVHGQIYVNLPAGATLIEKDLEGIPEILRIVYQIQPHMVEITAKDNRLIFLYRPFSLIDRIDSKHL